MSKELPYFRFYPSEWLEGDITLENEKTQGFFMLLCAWYWKKDCTIDLNFINKRLINGKATIKQCLNNLINSNIIKVVDNKEVSISFLNIQYDILSEKRQKYAEAGRKGGKATLKQRSSYKDKYKDKDNNKDKEEFKVFFDLYHKTTGLNKTDKEPTFKKWDQLTKKEKENAINNIKPYYDSLKDGKYCKKARTYLNDKNFNDEFEDYKGGLNYEQNTTSKHRRRKSNNRSNIN